ncbi:MAG: arginine--tRNA ligase [Armatimonadetes bacterium]|nr:arginine--tRNA ligase [Armatimonadota bacterium]
MIKDQLAALLTAALEEAKNAGDLPLEAVPPVTLEMPRSREHGDWATSVALSLASATKMKPRDIAAKIVARLPVGDGSPIARADIAGPGFINLTLRPDWLGDILRRIGAEGDAYGRSDAGGGKKVLVEFVSTNPNGPITVAGGRNAAIGDVLCSLLEAVGCQVTREYYVNDALNSAQMNNFGRSVFVRYREILGHPLPWTADAPDWFYAGDYIADVARNVEAMYGTAYEDADIDDPETVARFREMSESGMIAQQKADLEAFGVRFDVWFHESTLHKDGRVQVAVETLKARGYTYEKDGALWFRTTAFPELGDDKDRVIVRADGAPTYIAGDAAYHKDKLDRADKALNIWGADHAGYVARTKAAVAAMGYDPARVDVLLYQLVHIMKNGEEVKSSKRKGNVLELKSDLIDEVGRDAARFFYLMRSPNSDLLIDVDLAKKTEKDNPVYYVQYAHARIIQAVDKAREERGVAVPRAAETDLSLLTEETEADLIKKLSEFPDEVRLAAQDYAPQRLTQYARDRAAVFHGFYDAGNRNPALRVVCEDEPTMRARLVLVNATRLVLRNVLTLLGLSAPDRM